MIEPPHQPTPHDLVGTADNRLPSVTVIVLNYNSREHLQSCFRSLLALDYPADRLELMLVDNASTDHTLSFMAQAFPQVAIVRNPENYGFAEGNNIGAREAGGEMIAFLNPDMRVEPDWLRELVQPLASDPEIVCAGSKILSWDGKLMDFGGGATNFCGYGFQIGWGLPAKDSDPVTERFMLAPCGGAMIVDKATFLDVGGFDKDYFAFYEDLDLGWRLWVMGHKVAFASRAVAYHIHHGSWGQVPSEKTAVLYQRNAFSTMFKNYDDQNLKRIMPIALLLYLRRTYLWTELGASHLRSESPAVAPQLHTEVPPTDVAPAPPRAAFSPAQPIYDNAYYLREAWRTVRHEGPARLWSKAAAELRRRWCNRSKQPFTLTRRKQQLARPGYSVVNRRAISHLIAADDLMRDWEHLTQKRQAVQRCRRRSDQEIFRLFRQPFRAEYLNPHYVQTLEDLAAACELHNLFEPE